MEPRAGGMGDLSGQEPTLEEIVAGLTEAVGGSADGTHDAAPQMPSVTGMFGAAPTHTIASVGCNTVVHSSSSSSSDTGAAGAHAYGAVAHMGVVMSTMPVMPTMPNAGLAMHTPMSMPMGAAMDHGIHTSMDAVGTGSGAGNGMAIRTGTVPDGTGARRRGGSTGGAASNTASSGGGRSVSACACVPCL